MSQEPLTVRRATAQLFSRYRDMLEPSSHEHWLCTIALEQQDDYPIDKLSRWLGFVQGVLHCRGITSSRTERDFSRPLFHEAYRNEGVEIPQTLNNPNQG
jgi:hypothetical protein